MAASLERLSPQRRKAALPATILMTGLVALGGCAYQSATPGEAALPQSSPAPEQVSLEHLAPADFQMVDCQLPPRIHRIGVELVYLGPTRQLRTTTRDCVIRGGDLVIQDGANKAT